MTTQRISLFQQHVMRWKDCTKCLLHMCRQKVVLARGTIPCDLLFIGEAPGNSEDVVGRPFCGPAGKLLDTIIERGVAGRCTVALTNLVCCIPLGEDGAKVTEPDAVDIHSCSTRLNEFVHICQPKGIVCVGALPKRHIIGQAQFERDGQPITWIPDGKFMEFIEITHPAAILRNPVAQHIAVQRCVARLREISLRITE